MDDEHRTRVLSLHQIIVQKGAALGEIIPSLVPPPEVNAEVHEAASFVESLAPGVVIEVEPDNGAVLFKFADPQGALQTGEGVSCDHQKGGHFRCKTTF